MSDDQVTSEPTIYPALTYNRVPFPVVVLDGKPWWSTAHVQHAFGSLFKASECQYFTELHVSNHRFPFDAEDQLSHVISSLAALELANRRFENRGSRMFSSWLRKRDAELRTAAPDRVGTLYRVDARQLVFMRPMDGGPLDEEWDCWRERSRALLDRIGGLFGRKLSSQGSEASAFPPEPLVQRQRRLIAEADEQRRTALAIRDAREAATHSHSITPE